MSGSPQLTRSQLIHKHLNALIAETPETKRSFGIKVREHYESTVPEYSRRIDEFSTLPDMCDAADKDAVRIWRWFDESYRTELHCDLEDSIIASFPAERRNALETDLAKRRGRLSPKIPTPGNSESTIAEITKEFSDVLREYAKDNTCPKKLSREINEAIAALNSLAVHVEPKHKIGSVS